MLDLATGTWNWSVVSSVSKVSALSFDTDTLLSKADYLGNLIAIALKNDKSITIQ